jgi:F-type H+-transporting ATPase subunit gamma
MPTLEQLRKKIHSGEQLHSIVKTMKTIAAVSIRQYERAVQSLAVYSQTVELGLQVVLKNRPAEVRTTRAKDLHRLGVVVFGSDQGMCGQFNEQIASHAAKTIEGMASGVERRPILAIGERVVGVLERMGQPVEERLPVPSSLAGITPAVQDILLKIDVWRSRDEIDQLLVFHNQPASGSSYRPRTLRLLPIDRRWLEELEAREWPTHVLPTFTMDWGALLSTLVRQYLFVALYRACAESLSAENASRIASMQAAEKNIEEKLEELNMLFRHERQRAITEELFDIVSGFEALA